MTNSVITGYFSRLSGAENALALLNCLGFARDHVAVRMRTGGKLAQSWADAAYAGMPEGVFAGAFSGMLSGGFLAVVATGGWPDILTLSAFLSLGTAGGAVVGAVTELLRRRYLRREQASAIAIRVFCRDAEPELEEQAREVFQQAGAQPIEVEPLAEPEGISMFAIRPWFKFVDRMR